MRFAVLGAGAIGAFVGASIAHHDAAEVVLVARGAHREAMARRGVQVRSARGEFSAHPEVSDDIAALAGADVVFVGLKSHQIPPLAARLGEVLDPGAAVIWAQNGVPFWYFQSMPGPLESSVVESVDPGGVISRSIADRHHVGCVVYCAAELVMPGVVRHIEGTRFSIGEPSGEASERCRAISRVFAGAGLKAPVEQRLREQVWLKLIGNVAFNPASALTRATLGELGEIAEMVQLLRELLGECAAVAGALGVSMPVSIDRRLEAGIAVGDHKTSMLQDFEAGKPLELDCMTGAVIELGGKLGVEVPRVRAVHALALLADTIARRRPAGVG